MIRWFIFICLNLLLVSELFLSFYSYKLEPEIYPTIYEPDSMCGFVYKPNSFGNFYKHGIGFKKIKINSMGFHGPEMDLSNPLRKFRIAIVGTSNVSGIWMQGSKDLRKSLQDLFNINRLNVEVINCGSDGVGRDKNNIDIIKNKVILYKPNLVLLNADIPICDQPYTREVYNGKVICYKKESCSSPYDSRQYVIDLIDEGKKMNAIIPYLYKHLATVRFFFLKYFQTHGGQRTSSIWKSRLTEDMIGPFSGDYHEYSLPESISMLTDVKNVLRHFNCDFSLVQFSSFDASDDINLNKFNIKQIFLPCKFDRSSFSWPDSHLNEKGHSEIAKHLFKALLQNYPQILKQ